MGIIKRGTGSNNKPVAGWGFNQWRALDSTLSCTRSIYPVWCCGYSIYRETPPDPRGWSGSQWREEIVYETRAEAATALLEACDSWWQERRQKIVELVEQKETNP